MRVASLSLAFVFMLGCASRGANSGGGGSGGSSSSSGGDAATQSCSMPGATRACCGAGTQTCAGVEFPTWGPCLAADGSPLQCTGGTCQTGEFSQCDGGVPPMPKLCKAGGANNEPEILVGYAPANGQSVGAGGQIKVWVNDEAPPIIATHEVIDAQTGAITTPGDRTVKAPDGYLWEPALYIAPETAENGGTPHFADFIRGDYNNSTRLQSGGMEPPPTGSKLD